MRLLLDENLSESIAGRVRVAFPDTEHVRRVLGSGRPDAAVWSYAKSAGRTLVTLDADFQILSVKHGAPPKLIWIAAHNASNPEIAHLLIDRCDAIIAFGQSAESTMLVLRAPRRQ